MKYFFLSQKQIYEIFFVFLQVRAEAKALIASTQQRLHDFKGEVRLRTERKSVKGGLVYVLYQMKVMEDKKELYQLLRRAKELRMR